MDTNTNAHDAKPDWTQLAKEALDIWQNHLTSLAADPKAKEEMARFISPMGQMFTDWTNMMHQSMQGMMGGGDTTCASEPEAAPQPPSEPMAHEPDVSAAQPCAVVDEPVVAESPQPAASAPTDGGAAPSERARNLAELADRLAFLERELEGLRLSRIAGRGEQDDESAGTVERMARADQG